MVLVVREAGARIVQASAHAGDWLGQPLENLLLGPVDELGGDLGARLREVAERDDTGAADVPVAFPCTIRALGAPRMIEAWVHRAGPGLLTVDLLPHDPASFERSGVSASRGALPDPNNLLQHLEDAIHALSQAHSIAELSVEAARRVQALSGHEEVRIVRFGHEAGASIVAASRDGGDALCAALAWPVDLHGPSQGWADETSTGVHVLVDAWDEPVALLPHHLPGPASPAAAVQVVSASTLRSPEPSRLARLRQAGVRSQACAVLRREGKPWGLVVCLDGQSARPLPAAHRYAFGLLVEAMATRITAIESAGRAEVAEQVRRLQDLLVDATTREGNWRGAWARKPQLLLEPLQASGAALLREGDVLPCGSVPTEPVLQAIAARVDARCTDSVWHSDDPATDDPALACQVPAGTRLLAARLSVGQPDFLLWFRAAGAPEEAPAPPWSSTDLARAASFAEMLVDLMVQADAVRLLVTDRQLERLQGKVTHSREAVVIFDALGRVTLANVAFGELTGRSPSACRTLDDFLALFTPTAMARRLAGQVRAEQRSARGVLALPRPDGSALPVAVRAEPVLARSGRLLGLIFLVEDLTSARLAEAAWTQLQGLLVATEGGAAQPEVDPIVSAIRTHASLAAMDLADSSRTPGLAPLLQEVESATQRAISLYQRLSAMLRDPERDA